MRKYIKDLIKTIIIADKYKKNNEKLTLKLKYLILCCIIQVDFNYVLV